MEIDIFSQNLNSRFSHDIHIFNILIFNFRFESDLTRLSSYNPERDISPASSSPSLLARKSILRRVLIFI